MNPHNLQTSAVALLITLFSACGNAPAADDGRDESFLALMGSDGKSDSGVVSEGSAEAIAVLTVANEASFHDLHDVAGLDRLATANIISHRGGDPGTELDNNPFDSLLELDETPWVGLKAFNRLRQFARDAGYLDRVLSPVSCETSDQCGPDAVCHVDRCYERSTLVIDVPTADALGLGGDGEWWVRGEAGERTIREARGSSEVDQVETNSYDAPVSLYVAEAVDGSMTAVTESGGVVVAEGWPDFRLPRNTTLLDATLDGGSLWLAAETRDDRGTAQGLVVYRGTAEGWRDDLKHPLTGLREADEHQTAKFVRRADGVLQLWTDIDASALRFDRDTAGQWRQSMRIDMAGEGFGARASERQVEFMQAANDAVFIRRSTWSFALKQQVLRVEGSMVTAVIDLPTTVRAVVPHPDLTLSLIYADGTLGKVVNSEKLQGDGALSPPTPDTVLRARGDDLYVFRDGELTVLRAR